jgi:hypothetical protein
MMEGDEHAVRVWRELVLAMDCRRSGVRAGG